MSRLVVPPSFRNFRLTGTPTQNSKSSSVEAGPSTSLTPSNPPAQCRTRSTATTSAPHSQTRVRTRRRGPPRSVRARTTSIRRWRWRAMPPRACTNFHSSGKHLYLPVRERLVPQSSPQRPAPAAPPSTSLRERRMRSSRSGPESQMFLEVTLSPRRTRSKNYFPCRRTIQSCKCVEAVSAVSFVQLYEADSLCF